MPPDPSIPRWLRAGARLLPGAYRAEVLDDLVDERTTRLRGGGSRFGTACWVAGHLVRSAVASRRRGRFAVDPGVPPARGRARVEAVWQDLRLGGRLLARQPGFALTAVLTLALGVGANAAIFTVAWQTLLKPLPYPGGERLVRVWETFQPNDTPNLVMPANFHDWERDAHSFQAIAAFTARRGTADLTGGGEPEQWNVRYVTGAYFDVFGLEPIVGRVLDRHDVDNESPAVVISESAWRRRFGADPAIAGRAIRLGGEPRAVIGVMPAAFSIAGGDVDAWAPLSLPPEEPGTRLRAHYLGVVARLEPGATVEGATAEVKGIAARAATRYPEANGKLSAKVQSLRSLRGGTVRSGLHMLWWAAAFVLLIACANLASLQLARAARRTRELGVRAALGASRGRLVAQLLTENLVLSACGTVAGLALSWWVLRAIGAIAPPDVRLAASAGFQPVVVIYAAAVAIGSALLFGAAPAWHAAKHAARALGQRTHTSDRGATRARAVLVTSQVALAVMLVVAATLLITSLARVLAVDPGFNPHGLFTFDVSLPNARFDTFARREQLIDGVMRELAALPGVTATCAINEIPFDEPGGMTYVPEGRTDAVGASPRTVTPGCFAALDVRLLRGRLFRDHESTRVGIVTKTFADQAWSGADPIGRRVHLGIPTGDLIEVVGVVSDSRQYSLESRPYAQFFEFASEDSAFWPERIVARAVVPPESLFTAVRSAVRRVDPDQPVARLRTLDDVVGASLANRRFDLSLVSGFTFVAIVLAAVGIYGLLAQIVAQRTSEIGVRLALGATRGSAVRLVMASAWRAVAIGVPVGLAGAAAASGLLRSFVFGVSPTAPAIYVLAASGLAAMAVGAAWLAARRAARVDPIVALRQ